MSVFKKSAQNYGEEMIHIPIQLQSTQEEVTYFIFLYKINRFLHRGFKKKSQKEKGECASDFSGDVVPSGNY